MKMTRRDFAFLHCVNTAGFALSFLIALSTPSLVPYLVLLALVTLLLVVWADGLLMGVTSFWTGLALALTVFFRFNQG